jgi:endonuclease YncB( thermonuclease family)
VRAVHIPIPAAGAGGAPGWGRCGATGPAGAYAAARRAPAVGAPRRLGGGGPTSGSRVPAAPPGTLLLALQVLAVVLAGCAVSLWPGGGSLDEAPPGLATTRAERAGWPDPPGDAVAAEVRRVTDGDTFVATVAGREERVRVIGVDTPETVAPDRPVEPFGKQAAAFAERYLAGATVRLAGDAESRDRYGRMLAYVWLADGTFWNALLVAEGYAQQLTIPPNVAYAGLFRRLAAEARREQRGLWAA